MIKLSVVIITLNEEKNLARCLQSVLSIADEILVVDSFSTDKTNQIAESFKARFIEHPFKGHIEQKNYALQAATHPYVLSLDADEALSEELAQSIMQIKNHFVLEGYSCARLTNYAGQWIHHCGWYPDIKLRLVQKDKALWSGVNPHDILTLKNQTQHRHTILKGDLLHYSYESVASHILQTNKFTTIAAIEAHRRGVRSGIFKIITRPILKFLRDYFFKKGFLDGRYGLIICTINALSAFLKYTKIDEIERGKLP